MPENTFVSLLTNSLFTPFVVGIVAVLYGVFLIFQIQKMPAGDKKMQEVAGAIAQGAQAYLKRQAKSIGIFALIIAVLLGMFLKDNGWLTAWGFLVGAFFSGLAGFIGMNVSVKANVRTAEIAKKGLPAALDLAFKGGTVTGMFVAGLGILSVTLFILILYWFGVEQSNILQAIIGLGFGGSLISLFARIGGGIYTKAADVGADLVGKIEANIPEDDPRNPAVIADNVGDNVGDCAGMAADLFETFVVTIIGSIILGMSLFSSNVSYLYFPLLLASVGIIAGIIGTFTVKMAKQHTSVILALYRGLLVSAILAIGGFFFVVKLAFPNNFNYFWPSLIGILIGVGLFAVTEYYTSKRFKVVKKIAESSKSGAATNIIEGLAAGLESTFVPVLLVVAGIILSYLLAGGIYGIAIAVTAMLSLTGMIIALDAYGPITDNAGGIAEMANLSKEVRQVTDALDAVGNTTKAVTKSFAIGSAGLAALTLFAAYLEEIRKINLEKVYNFALDNPLVVAGLFIGGAIPFLFSSMALRSVGRAAFKVIEEVRRQFKEIPGILENKAKPDYGMAVDIVTKAALKEMIAPAILAVISPLLVGFILGPIALGGLLLGVIITGLFIALQMANGGAAWDNAKKYIEDGNFGGKGTDAHKAAVVGDTVGDPYKDTAGPAINPLIKVINTIAIIFAATIVLNSLNLF